MYRHTVCNRHAVRLCLTVVLKSGWLSKSESSEMLWLRILGVTQWRGTYDGGIQLNNTSPYPTHMLGLAVTLHHSTTTMRSSRCCFMPTWHWSLVQEQDGRDGPLQSSMGNGGVGWEGWSLDNRGAIIYCHSIASTVACMEHYKYTETAEYTLYILISTILTVAWYSHIIMHNYTLWEWLNLVAVDLHQ